MPGPLGSAGLSPDQVLALVEALRRRRPAPAPGAPYERFTNQGVDTSADDARRYGGQQDIEVPTSAIMGTPTSEEFLVDGGAPDGSSQLEYLRQLRQRGGSLVESDPESVALPDELRALMRRAGVQ
jgi:hypothetical protein